MTDIGIRIFEFVTIRLNSFNNSLHPYHARIIMYEHQFTQHNHFCEILEIVLLLYA